MQFSSLVVALALAAASSHAAECTADMMSKVQTSSEYKKAESSCSGVLSLASGPQTTEAAKKICEQTNCLSSMSAMIAVLPDCTVQGLSFKSTYESALSLIGEQCKQLGVSVETTPSAATSGAAAASVSASAATLVVAAVVYAQL